MGKYKIDKFIINQSLACCDTCDIRIVGKPNINHEDMKMIKDHIESIGNEYHINVTTPSISELAESSNRYVMIAARGNGKTNYFKDWLFNQYLWTRPTKVIFHDPATIYFKDWLFNQYSWTRPTKVIFHDPATIVFWNDGTKTVVKCQPGDVYSKEMGLALCFSKKMLGNQSNFNNVFKKWIPEE